MAILTGKPSSISANTTSSSITLDTTELMTLVDSATTDQYWKDIARVKSVLFVYRNSSRQKVNLKFTMPSTTSTVSINENSRNGSLQCSKIVLTGTANDTLTISRSEFSSTTEFDLTVTDGYVAPTPPGFSGTAPITWVEPLSSTYSTAVVEADGGIYKSTGPGYDGVGGNPAYDLSLKSSQELSSAEGYIEIDAIHYNSQFYLDESQKYGSSDTYEYVVGFSSGERSANGDYSNLDFSIRKASITNPLSGLPFYGRVASYQNGMQSQILGQLSEPNYSGPGGGGGPSATMFKNKLRIQLKNGNVEFFVNNVKYQTLVGALTSVTFPIFAEVSLLKAYTDGSPGNFSSGFPSARISSTLSTSGTIVKSVDFTGPEDLSTYGSQIYTTIPEDSRGSATILWGSYLELNQGSDLGGPLLGEAIVIKNSQVYDQSGNYEDTFYSPLVDGNPYIVRVYINDYVNNGSNPTLSITMREYDFVDMVTISSSELSSAVGSYVDIAFTPDIEKSVMPDGTINPVLMGIRVFSNNTTDTEYIRISKIEFIEA